MRKLLAAAVVVCGVVLIATAQNRRSADPVQTEPGFTLPAQQAASFLALPTVQPPAAPRAPAQSLVVTYNKGLLSIAARDASLDDILNKVHEVTGVGIEAPIMDQHVSIRMGPQPPLKAIAALLQEFHLNYALLGGSGKRAPVNYIIVIPESGAKARGVAPLDDAAAAGRARARAHLAETGGDEGVWDAETQSTR